MNSKILVEANNISRNKLNSLERRELGLWIHGSVISTENAGAFVDLIKLPWHSVIIDGKLGWFANELEATADEVQSLIRKRGFIEIIDNDPSLKELPPRSLPVYLLDGRNQEVSTNFTSQLRRLTMLEAIRKSNFLELIIISSNAELIPSNIDEIWEEGFRVNLTIISGLDNTETILNKWLQQIENLNTLEYINGEPSQIAREIYSDYFDTFTEDKTVLRIKDSSGTHQLIDVTLIDEIERPLLENYELIQERDLSYISPEDLDEQTFVDFFEDSSKSWKPYAADLPWVKDHKVLNKLKARLSKLEEMGADDNFIAYISSEPGAGGTTLGRYLAFRLALEGFPTLVAKTIPFDPDVLPVANFITRVNQKVSRIRSNQIDSKDFQTEFSDSFEEEENHNDLPWIILFDTLHWQNREMELIKFLNVLAKSGRSACILFVTGSITLLNYQSPPYVNQLCELNHAIELKEAEELGEHLNRFLQVYGKTKNKHDWRRFHQEHATQYTEGIAAFWVTLSFWIRGRYNLDTSIQTWIYNAFKNNVKDSVLQIAVLQIAAMSSERMPIPQGLLPTQKGKWPVWQLLDDIRSELSGLGLIKIVADRENYWALIHDVLGRLLINAFFYDQNLRNELGLSDAKDNEHLRFLLLKSISKNQKLEEKRYKAIGESFAKDIFKIEPERGTGAFLNLWQDVLNALDEMPKLLQDTSRVFRHHTAISRRRLAKFAVESDVSQLYDLGLDVVILLLRRAVSDINFALKEIEYTPGGDSDLNLLNSLALAYFDLANAEELNGSSQEIVDDLRQKAKETTLRLYQESPNNTFVIETYVTNLLATARDTKSNQDLIIESCISALSAIFSAIGGNVDNVRIHQLEILAETAMKILLKQTPKSKLVQEPQSELDVLLQAWVTLGTDEQTIADHWSLEKINLKHQKRAIEILTHPLGLKNLQAIRLSYDLTCNVYPFDHKRQIDLLEQLYYSDYTVSPQLSVEYAILLFQVNRPTEGDKLFYSFRRSWRSSDSFVHIPPRLRWLREPITHNATIVRAITETVYDNRSFAKVREFNNARVAFRPEEHGFSDIRPGINFRSYVTFGPNGPYLRALSTNPPTP